MSVCVYSVHTKLPHDCPCMANEILFIQDLIHLSGFGEALLFRNQCSGGQAGASDNLKENEENSFPGGLRPPVLLPANMQGTDVATSYEHRLSIGVGSAITNLHKYLGRDPCGGAEISSSRGEHREH